LSVTKWEKKSAYILLSFLTFYLATGNITRFYFAGMVIPFPLAEVLLYVLVVKYLFINNEKIGTDVCYLSLIFLASFFIGFFKNLAGIDVPSLVLAFSYTLRICCVLILLYIIGKRMSVVFTVKKVISYYMTLYYVQAFFSLLILIFFPDSSELWQFLTSINLHFEGDPHQHRLVGVFFDPNLYGSLLILPVLLFFAKASYCRYELKNYVQMVFFLFLLGMTFSRSALMGVAIGIVLMNFVALINSLNNFAKLRKVLLSTTLIFLQLSYILFFTRYAERFSGMAHDDSALCRWRSFKNAINLFITDWNSVVGIGYGYFSLYKDYTIGVEFDASLLNYIICLGLPLAILGGFFLRNIISKSLKYYKDNEYYLYIALTTYLLALLVITVFNNWLFVPFFLFTIGPILMYGYVNNETAARLMGKGEKYDA